MSVALAHVEVRTTYALAAVDPEDAEGALVILEAYRTERDARIAAETLCREMASSARGLRSGEGYWIVELRPVRYVGRP